MKRRSAAPLTGICGRPPSSVAAELAAVEVEELWTGSCSTSGLGPERKTAGSAPIDGSQSRRPWA